MRYIIPISGKDSLATAIVQRARQPDLPYEYLFLDVGMELPETYAWLDKVEAALGISIHRCGRNLEEMMAEAGILPSHHRRFCTEKGKIGPLIRYLSGDEAVQYVGIRADEDRPNLRKSADNLEDRYPLKELGIDLIGVYRLLGQRELMPPDFFWKRLWDDVYGELQATSRRYMDEMPPWVRSYLFSWRSRSNCFMCFYQRLPEWVGLLEHHPDLFARAERIEIEYGESERRERPFTLRNDFSLRVVRLRAEEIYRERFRKVKTAVIKFRNRVEDSEFDLLSMTSCGNYCGK